MASKNELDFIGTITENDKIEIEPESSESEEEENVAKTAKKKKPNHTEFNISFQFNDQLDPYQNISFDDIILKAKRKKHISALDDKIADVRKKRKREKAGDNNGINEDELNVDPNEEESSSGEEMATDVIRTKEKRKRKKMKVEEEIMEFSECIDTYDENMGFADMNVTRPLMKALSVMNFEKPTPIQAATIPKALMGKDLCACAVTGSGKTVAFMLPIMERLLYKPKNSSVSRVLILVPTRELAVQVHTVGRKLAQFSTIELCLAVGGLDLKSQEAALRLGPDIVIATPGRLIDHLHNSPGFSLGSIEILVLDEADRMLDEYFAEQMHEIIKMCSYQRQTMLFSATMTEGVQELAAVSLKNPVKIFMNEATDVAMGLRQEFIRIRPNREGDREAIVAALVSRTFCDRCLVFIQTRAQAHRMHILLGLFGVNVGELHGRLSQAERLESLKKFQDGLVDVMLATDLAARGLDIKEVKTVINFTMPNTTKHYIHRVGRTARAGKSGRSVTLVGEKERKMLKEVVKKAVTPLKVRIVPQEVISKYRDEIASMEGDISQIMLEQQEEKELKATEKKVNKAEDRLQKQDDLTGMSRTWFQTHQERRQEKKGLRRGEKPDFKSKSKDKVKKFKTPEERVEKEMKTAQLYGNRVSKKNFKQTRMRAYGETKEKSDKLNRISKNKQKKLVKSSEKKFFDKELTSTDKPALKKFRKGPSYQERKDMGLVGKKSTPNKFLKNGGGKNMKAKGKGRR
ncbi:probable ATP-dependent RNA helicase DDX27 [Patella vulgata]|uniref:probable ATP-dependent RNA helicase DDX27 n=1 Tax=Patella vulgata TaxID=6465 RepID=UPI002180712C|nr:probable ATP-dependent RNA helicase DDX27 [Patella vulgata]